VRRRVRLGPGPVPLLAGPHMKSSYRIFSLSGSTDLAKRVADHLATDLGALHNTVFSDGEVHCRFGEPLRGRRVVVLGQVNAPYEKLFELLVTLDAARRAAAQEIVCVAPYLPHSRQERRDKEGTSVTARLLADFLQLAGAHRLITIDLHSPAIEGFYTIPVDHLDMSQEFCRHIHARYGTQDLCICSPDLGGVKRARKMKNLLNANMAVIEKERLRPNQVASMEIVGDVKAMHVIIVDDIVDTAGTLCKAADMVMQAGALSVAACCTHGVLSGAAVRNIGDSRLEQVVVTDTIKLRESHPKIHTVSCSGLLARAIERLGDNECTTSP